MQLPSPNVAALLEWYDRHARALPWRISPQDRAQGVMPDPYRVWLSEIMLQQTTVAAVKPYFEAFLLRWPKVTDLAAADEADVMRAWAGLGYYSRARNLEACAKLVAGHHNGTFPATEAGLLSLPGIGPYTAAAIAAIAFDQPATVVDGNVERVISRIFRVETPLPAARPEIRRLATSLTPPHRPGDYAQAMMDLGATICTPKSPACALCPWSDTCAARRAGEAATYPRKAAKTARPTRTGEAFVCRRADGAILLRRRPPEGLLGGMSEVPTTDWLTPTRPRRTKTAASPPQRLHGAPDFISLKPSWRTLSTRIEHTFTHFHLILSIRRADFALDTQPPDGHWWSTRDMLPGEALPSVMRKVIDVAQNSPA